MNNLISIKRDLVEVGRRVYARGYVASNAGTISARLDDQRVVITPTGVSKGFMSPEDMCVVDLDGKVVQGTKKPSSEVFMHLAVYKNRPDINSVCHAHPAYATGFAVAGIPLDKCILPEVIIALGGIPVVEYGTPGTEEFFRPVLKVLDKYDAFLLANHGALTIGKDIFNAYHKMETLEHFAHIAFVAQQLEKHPGPVVASTDYIKSYAEQIRPFLPKGRTYKVLGTDGFGRSDFRSKLREHFEVNRHYIVVAALKALSEEGTVPVAKVSEAIKKYGLNVDKVNPLYA